MASRKSLTKEEHHQIIQNFLNMVCFETQGRGGDSGKLVELLEEYFRVSEEDKLMMKYEGVDFDK